MRLNRRDFMKGLLAISGAAVIAPLLPPVGVAAETPALAAVDVVSDEAVWQTAASQMGRLGRVRLNRTWLPLEDVWIRMKRNFSNLIMAPTSQPGVYQQIQSRQLVDSPWELQLWTSETPALDSGDAESYSNDMVEFEIVPYRSFSFFGRGYMNQFGIDNTIIGRERDNQQPVLTYSFVLEGNEKLKYSAVAQEKLRWWEEAPEL